MCGIFGFTGGPEPDLADRMASRLSHRGPDGSGFIERADVTLGSTRLAIVGVANGDQPIEDEAGELALVANGEIYNHVRLRDELEQRGHRFATESDAEVILHLYEEEGESLVERLDGMFAFALLDIRRRRLLLARDRMGMKPLHYVELDGRLLFASEMKALFADPEVPRRLDPGALDGLLSLLSVPHDRTLFAEIRRVPPGHLVRIEGERVDVHRYWTLDVAPRRGAGPTDPVPEFRRIFEGAVASHLATEVPQAFSLSGGLDSSLLVATARRLLDQPVRTFAIGSPGPRDDRPAAREVAESLGTEHTELELRPEDWARVLPHLIWHLEEPRGGPLVALDRLFAAISSEARVVLSGEGSDELFGGYERMKSVVGPLAWLPSGAARRIYSVSAPLAVGRRTLFTPPFRSRIARPTFEDRLLAPVFGHHGAARRDAVLAYEQTSRMPEWNLSIVDRLAMSHSLEARLPFLDRHLVDFANRLPAHWKMRWRGEKRIVREAARGLLPDSARRRPKRGLSDPQRLWAADAATVDWVRDLVNESAGRRGYFRRAYLERLLGRATGAGLRGFDRSRLLLFAQLEVWHRLFIDPASLATTMPPGRLVS